MNPMVPIRRFPPRRRPHPDRPRSRARQIGAAAASRIPPHRAPTGLPPRRLLEHTDNLIRLIDRRVARLWGEPVRRRPTREAGSATNTFVDGVRSTLATASGSTEVAAADPPRWRGLSSGSANEAIIAQSGALVLVTNLVIGVEYASDASDPGPLAKRKAGRLTPRFCTTSRRRASHASILGAFWSSPWNGTGHDCCHRVRRRRPQ
jgi:hypothetical protein